MATGSMPIDTASRYAMGLPTLPETERTADRQYAETAGEQERTAKKDITGLQGEAARDVAKTQADAAIAVAKIRAGYNKGGTVVDVGYKHSNNPMYAKFASTMDSSLLAKSRGRK